MQKRKKILIVHNYYQLAGGEDYVVECEKKMLEEYGHDVLLYTRNNSEIKRMRLYQKVCLPFNTIFSIKTYVDVKRIIKKNNIDVIHVHNTLNLISPSVYYSALSCKVPVVQTIHNYRLICPNAEMYRNNNICTECIENGLNRAIRYKCYRNSYLQTIVCVVMLKFHRLLGTYYKIGQYICLSQQMKNIMKVFIPEDLISVKANYSNNIDIEENINRKISNDYYLYLGRIEKNKGIDMLINTFENLTDKKLIIAGNGTCLDKILERVKKVKNVEYVGFVKKDIKEKLIREAKALIVPSQWLEPFGVGVIEAFSVGTPVIASDVGTLSELIEEGKTGYKFERKSSKSLREAIYKLEKDDYSKLVENTLKVYSEKYSEEKNYEILMNIYDNTIQKNVKI